MDKHITINKKINFQDLTDELKSISSKVSGLSLFADTDLTVHGADDLTEQQILDTVQFHIYKTKQDKMAGKINALPLDQATKNFLHELLDAVKGHL